MAAITKIKYNPATGEIEIEGTEAFVKKYFEKLQGKPVIKQAQEEPAPKKKGRRGRPGRPKGTGKKIAPSAKPAKAVRAAKKSSGKSSMTGAILQMVKKNAGGIKVADIAKKTGIKIQPLSNILWRLKKEGKISSAGRGVYAPA